MKNTENDYFFNHLIANDEYLIFLKTKKLSSLPENVLDKRLKLNSYIKKYYDYPNALEDTVCAGDHFIFLDQSLEDDKKLSGLKQASVYAIDKKNRRSININFNEFGISSVEYLDGIELPAIKAFKIQPELLDVQKQFMKNSISLFGKKYKDILISNYLTAFYESKQNIGMYLSKIKEQIKFTADTFSNKEHEYASVVPFIDKYLIEEQNHKIYDEICDYIQILEDTSTSVDNPDEKV